MSEICPGCGKDMRYAFFKPHKVEGEEIYCCSQWCADKCKKTIDRGNVIFKCYVCHKWVKRAASRMKDVKRPTCSTSCMSTLKKRLSMAATLRPGDVSEPDGMGDDPIDPDGDYV